MNAAKLARLGQSVRIGGKGTTRRKRKTVHKSSSTDDKKLQQTLKNFSLNGIPQVEEVNMFKRDGTVLHFVNPKGIDLFLYQHQIFRGNGEVFFRYCLFSRLHEI